MAKAQKKEEFKTFNVEGENGNTFEGRLYLNPKETENAKIYPLSLTINGLAIIGAKYFDTTKGCFVKLPEYKGSDGDYHSLCYFFKTEDVKDFKDLANCIGELLK